MSAEAIVKICSYAGVIFSVFFDYIQVPHRKTVMS